MATPPPESQMAGFGPNEWLVDEIYQQFLADRDSVSPAWWEFFDGYTPPGYSPLAAKTAPAPTPEPTVVVQEPHVPAPAPAPVAPGPSAPAAPAPASPTPTPVTPAAAHAPSGEDLSLIHI